MSPGARALDEADALLIDFARNIVDSHSDGVVHTVAAAVADQGGRMFGGINLYHHTGGPCAELVALANARAGGANQLRTIVAVGDGGRGVIGPCGNDRQVLADYHPGIRVILPTVDGHLQGVPVETLLPWSCSWNPNR